MRKGERLDGWVAIDKPPGLTSTATLARARRAARAAKAGHAGTLDPLATGVLVIAFGEATKLVGWAMDRPKTYEFTVRWGEARDSDDAEGAVTATSASRPDRDAIEAALPRFLGTVMQRPPVYSALKQAGRRAYDLARAGLAVEPKERPVAISAFVLLDQPDRDHASFRVHCGKGTYVRSLARDLAAALGTLGHIAALRRTAVGPFTLAGAIALDKFEELAHKTPASDWLRPVETALDDIPALALTGAQAARLARGLALPLAEVCGPGTAWPATGTTVAALDAGRLVALAAADGPMLRPARVFNLQPRI